LCSGNTKACDQLWTQGLCYQQHKCSKSVVTVCHTEIHVLLIPGLRVWTWSGQKNWRFNQKIGGFHQFFRNFKELMNGSESKPQLVQHTNVYFEYIQVSKPLFALPIRSLLFSTPSIPFLRIHPNKDPSTPFIYFQTSPTHCRTSIKRKIIFGIEFMCFIYKTNKPAIIKSLCGHWQRLCKFIYLFDLLYSLKWYFWKCII